MDALVDLYRSAGCLVFPSLYEGFGLPPLEAMACGCPVAVSNATSLPEVCGDAAEYFDPLSPEDMAAAILRALDGRLVERGLARAARVHVGDACAHAHDARLPRRSLALDERQTDDVAVGAFTSRPSNP